MPAGGTRAGFFVPKSMSASKRIGPGRPTKFESPDQLRKAVNAYLAKCEKDGVPPTITRLCLSLGCTEKTLWNTGRREEFADVVEFAKMHVRAAYEDALHSAHVSGAIFALKSMTASRNSDTMEWTDKTAVELSGPQGGPIELTDTERAAKVASLLAAAQARKDADTGE